MRLIDAEILKRDISKYRESLKPQFLAKLTDSVLNDIYAIISDEPTVDAVEVVRCKDCKYYRDYKSTCEHWIYSHTPEKNAFCSRAVRKENVEE